MPPPSDPPAITPGYTPGTPTAPPVVTGAYAAGSPSSPPVVTGAYAAGTPTAPPGVTGAYTPGFPTPPAAVTDDGGAAPVSLSINGLAEGYDELDGDWPQTGMRNGRPLFRNAADMTASLGWEELDGFQWVMRRGAETVLDSYDDVADPSLAESWNGAATDDGLVMTLVNAAPPAVTASLRAGRAVRAAGDHALKP